MTEGLQVLVLAEPGIRPQPLIEVSYRDPFAAQSMATQEFHRQPTARRQVPEATFTPTAAGLCAGEGQALAQPMDIQILISETLSKMLVAGIQQGSQIPLMAPNLRLRYQHIWLTGLIG